MSETQWELHNLCWKHGLQPKEAINMFNEAGLISDLVVYFKDMADADCRKCIRFLNKQNQNTKTPCKKITQSPARAALT